MPLTNVWFVGLNPSRCQTFSSNSVTIDLLGVITTSTCRTVPTSGVHAAHAVLYWSTGVNYNQYTVPSSEVQAPTNTCCTPSGRVQLFTTICCTIPIRGVQLSNIKCCSKATCGVQPSTLAFYWIYLRRENIIVYQHISHFTNQCHQQEFTSFLVLQVHLYIQLLNAAIPTVVLKHPVLL